MEKESQPFQGQECQNKSPDRGNPAFRGHFCVLCTLVLNNDNVNVNTSIIGLELFASERPVTVFPRYVP